MPTLDTMTVRFEADARNLLNDLNALETQLNRLQEGKTVSFPSLSDLQLRLTIAADEAVSRALSGAGHTLSQAIQSHETQFSQALAQSQKSLASALQKAADKVASSIRVTVPVYVDGQKVANAVIGKLRRQSVSGGSYNLL